MTTSVTVIGMQWGDEGKGKIVDCLNHYFDIGVRYNGGNNAGHTIIANSKKHVLSALPLSCIYSKQSIITNGCVVNPWFLLQEIKEIGHSIGKIDLMISETASVVIPDIHGNVEHHNNHIGTTKRGIGPCYTDKVNRKGIRVCDISYQSIMKEKIEALCAIYRITDTSVNDILGKFSELEECLQYAVSDDKIIKTISNNNTLLESAQGILLDISHGTYPFVTSSTVIPPANIINSKNINIGVIKPYVTRVGHGPMVTKMQPNEHEIISNHGNEFGAVTNRARSCGWLDLKQLAKQCKICKIDTLAITKMDIINTLEQINVCTDYDGKEYEIYDPCYKKNNPKYTVMNNWCNISSITSWDALPKEALNYIKLIEEYTNVPVGILSHGPNRENIVYNTKIQCVHDIIQNKKI